MTVIEFGIANANVLLTNNIYKITLIYALNFIILISFFATFIALYTYSGKTLTGDLRLLVPGDIIEMPGHYVYVTSIEYIDGTRNPVNSKIKIIESTPAFSRWYVTNIYSLEAHLSRNNCKLLRSEVKDN